MKIDGIPPVEGTKAVNRPGKVEKKSPGLGTDQVAVSGQAQVFQGLVQKVKDLPDVREERVRALAGQIAGGQYKVDAQAVAKKLLPDN